jgi:MFS superfamily sulfate permease-like transporter
MFQHISRDFAASIVVFLVALPLCMGIAIASGVDPARGLITGIIGGIIVGFFAGCPLQVSGPAAGLTVIIYELITHHQQKFLAGQDLAAMSETAQQAANAAAQGHALMVLGIVVFLAGITQMLMALLRMGRWFRAVSPAVIYGMLAGIGVLIIAKQFHVMLDEQVKGSSLTALMTIPETINKAIQGDNESLHLWAGALGVLTIAVIVVWPMIAVGRLKLFPAPLLAIIIAGGVAAFFQFDVTMISVPSNILGEVIWPSTTWWDLIQDPSVITGALTIAAIASAETLLCATAVDKMQDGQRTQYERELFAQGVGNTICGIFSALPMTGVIVRSSANIQAGGKTRLSAILHGVWLLMFVAAVPFLLSYIPQATLAAILVYTGWKLINFKMIKSLWSVGKSEAFIYLTTVAVIVAEDLLIGVLVGLALSALKLLYTFSHLDAELQPLGEKCMVLKLRGACTFIRLPFLAETLEKVPDGVELRVELQDLDYIDHACFETLINWARQHEKSGGSLVMDWDTLHARFKQNGLRSTCQPKMPHARKVETEARREKVTADV